MRAARSHPTAKAAARPPATIAAPRKNSIAQTAAPIAAPARQIADAASKIHVAGSIPISPGSILYLSAHSSRMGPFCPMRGAMSWSAM